MTDDRGKDHEYGVRVEWTGNRGHGTRNYTGYDRAHVITSTNRPPLLGSSDAAFHGDGTRYNPEDLLVASLSACHMLWYLALSAKAGIVVTAYVDDARGTMVETSDGGGRFAEVVLRPTVTVRETPYRNLVADLHHRAHELCFIAQSVNFRVRYDVRTKIEGSPSPVAEEVS
jgi:organic hydroperoxide reductase OsmC/OhrA